MSDLVLIQPVPWFSHPYSGDMNRRTGGKVLKEEKCKVGGTVPGTE